MSEDKIQKEKIKNNIAQLKYIVQTLSLFHIDKYRQEISEINRILNKLKRNHLQNEDYEKILVDTSKFMNLMPLCQQINSVKDLLLFKALFENCREQDDEKGFKKAYEYLLEINKDLHKDSIKIKEFYTKYKIIIDKMIEKLGNNEKLFDKFMQQIKVFFCLKNEELIDDLIILFQSKKYEKEINSIVYFFKNFPEDKNFFNKLPNNYETISQKDFDELKKDLEMLKNDGIYNYKEKNNSSEFFSAFYEKKEPFDFLLSKTDKVEQISTLYNKIDPNNEIISIQDITNFEECVKIFKQFKDLRDNFHILTYIKNLSSEQINKFINYLKTYTLIIDLDNNENFGYNIYDRVNNIITNFSFIFYQDNEVCFFGENKEVISLEELIKIKNKIIIKDEKSEMYNDILEKKIQKLIFFKNLISNIEIIYDYMNFFRIKGSNLPISIKIQIKYPEINYIINEKEKSIEEIKSFLSKIKSDYISKLDECYKNRKYLRFLYGKLFRNMDRHFERFYNIDNILRFILNNTNNNEKIKDGNISNIYNSNDYLTQYQQMIENSFQNISNYMITLFNNNDTSLQKHYEKMLIKGNNICKGIYVHECVNESMEELVVKIYFDKLGQLPIAQNILICNKETTQEEVQAFFYRSILCDFNTLFTVIIYDSFTDYQLNLMYNFIDELLSYKREKMKIEKNKDEKEKTGAYLDSCIIFIYEDNKHDVTFLNKLGEDIKVENEKIDDKVKENNIIKNVRVISSDFCGLGKSYEIKKIISDHNKIYNYFTINETDCKNNIFEKLEKLLNKIKKENGEKFDQIAIHLDMPAHGNISAINEFLFSFLITKFYCYNENIIFIPNAIEIYIEVPNSFDNYLSKYGILNIFEIKNITLDTMPKLDLPEETINIFKNNLGCDSLDKIEKFIKDRMDMKNYSYYQVQIFIKIMFSPLNMFSSKLHFVKEGKDVTNEFIMDIVKSSKYFISNSFSKILLQKNLNGNNCLELLSKMYEYDLREKNYDFPLILIKKEKLSYKEISSKLNIQERRLKTNKNDIYEYLEKIKNILNIPNDIEINIGENKSLLSILNSDNYIITNDIFRKMILLYYRIKSNIPVILMGEASAGILSLITKLNQLLNNGKKNIQIINFHPYMSEIKISYIMKEINEKANFVENETWVYFNHINTYSSFSIIKEIFANRTFNGEKLNDKIRIIGSCYPYRIRKLYSRELKRKDNKMIELVYNVNPLPFSLLYYVFSFGFINQEDEKKYIFSILNSLFSEDEKKLLVITSEIICQCHEFLRKKYELIIVTLKDISKFVKLFKFFMKYYEIKEEFINKTDKQNKNLLFKIKSIICSIYICYYTHIINEMDKSHFNHELRPIMLKLVNSPEETDKNEERDDFIGVSLMDKIKYKPLKEDLSNEEIQFFGDLLRIEQDFIVNKIELDIGIGKNELLKENVFLTFVSLMTNIPLFLIGQTGTSKSLSVELINKSMKGKYSKDKFFTKFPRIIPINFTCSESTNPADVENIFQIAQAKFNYFYYKNNKEQRIFEILFDKMHLLETNTLNMLFTKLNYSGNGEGTSFIGLSNYYFNMILFNNSFVKCLPSLDEHLDALMNTSRCIVESISEDLSKEQIFAILPRAYYEYKNKLYLIQKLIVLKKYIIKNKDNLDLESQMFSEIEYTNDFKNFSENIRTIEADFHGIVNLYNLIKGVANGMKGLDNCDEEEIAQIAKKNIEENFGGLDYEIDIDLNLKLDDIRNEIDSIKDILKEGEKENDKIIIGSELMFKKIYNMVCQNNGLNDYQI